MKQKIKFPMLFVFLALSIYSCINDEKACDCIEIIITQCDHEDENVESTICEQLIGEWVEEDPLAFDGYSDTIVFTEDNRIEKHFIFQGCQYEVENCEKITFISEDNEAVVRFEFITDEKVIFYNFLDRVILSEITDITYIKLSK